MQCTQSAYPVMDRQLRRRTEHHSDRVTQEKALQEDSERAEQMGLRIQQVLEHLRRDFNKIKNHLGTYSFSNTDDGSDGCSNTDSIDTRQAWKDELCCMIKLVRNYVNIQHLGGFRLLHNVVNNCPNGKVCGACYRPKFKYTTPTGDQLCMDDSTCVSNPNLDVECLYQQLCNSVLDTSNSTIANVVERYWYTALVGVVKSAVVEAHPAYYDETQHCPVRDGYMPSSTRNHIRKKLAEYLSGIFESQKDKQGHVTPSPHAMAQAVLLTDLPSDLKIINTDDAGATLEHTLVYGLNGTDDAGTWKPYYVDSGSNRFADSASFNVFTFVEAIWHQTVRTFDIGNIANPNSRTIKATGVGGSYDDTTKVGFFGTSASTKLFIGGDHSELVDSSTTTASVTIGKGASSINIPSARTSMTFSAAGTGKLNNSPTAGQGSNHIQATPDAQTPLGIVYGWKYVIEDNETNFATGADIADVPTYDPTTGAYGALDDPSAMWSHSTMWPASELAVFQQDLNNSIGTSKVLQLTDNNSAADTNDHPAFNSFDETRVSISPVTAIISDDCTDANFNFVRGQINAMMETIRKSQIVNDCEIRTIKSVRDVSECNQAYHENAFGNLTQINEGQLKQRYDVGKQLLRDLDDIYRENCVTKQTFFKDVTLNGCL